MPPSHEIVFGSGASQTLLHPIVAVATVVAIILILVLPRKYVAIPFLLVIFTAPMGQQVLLGSVHLYVPRVLILFGGVRLLAAKLSSDKQLLAGGVNSVDRAFFWGVICQTLAVLLLFHELPATIYQFGFGLEYIGGYFLLRFLIRDEVDIYRVMKCLVLVTVIVSVGMVIEQLKVINIFGMLGGVSVTPEIREGRIRSQGPFGHELLAGAFGATLVPLLLLLWVRGKAKLIALIGIACATLMTFTSNSSTSLLTYAGVILAVCLWPIRKSMGAVRWGIVLALLGLQLVMKAPFWFLIAHVDLTGSSSSWHRAALVDQFIRHFWDWWLVGTKDTGSWGWDLWDTQNQFVTIGQSGGLLAFILFIAMISRAFGRLGRARKAAEGDQKQEWTMWLFGAALFSNVVSFFGVNYFDQTKFAWFALLAMISAATAPLLQSSLAAEAQLQHPVPKLALSYFARSSGRDPEANTTSVTGALRRTR